MHFEPARVHWLLFVGLVASCSAPTDGAAKSRAAQAMSEVAAGTPAAQAGTSATTDLGPSSPPPGDDGLVVPTAPVVPDAGAARPPDNDGFSVAEGDCNDFEDLINPGAYDVPGNGIDEDCDGSDAPSASCDEDLDIAATDPLLAAKAIELCQTANKSDRRWGVLSARWTTPDGKGKPSSDLLHGLLPSFGPSYTPRQGQRLLTLSSGVARAPGQPGATRDCSDELPAQSSGLPEGFDGSSSSCEFAEEITNVEDAVALEIELRVPSNVAAISFDSAFFTDEYPDYICSVFNDFFQVVVMPKRMGAGKEGNVVFDQDGNPVSVNNSLLRVCEPGEHGGKRFTCPLGASSLMGTGIDDCAASPLLPGGVFDDLDGMRASYGASTGWLHTQFAVEPGEVITMRFTIWDSGDSSLDSVAIIDHVRFHLRSEPPPPEQPKTTPIDPS